MLSRDCMNDAHEMCCGLVNEDYTHIGCRCSCHGGKNPDDGVPPRVPEELSSAIALKEAA